MTMEAPRTRGIESGLAFDETDCRRIIAEAWGRFTGQPVTGQTGNNNSRAPGFFGLTQRRRWHLYKLPQADPVLPTAMGEYPLYQSDLLRQKHWEMTSRLTENRFRIEATGGDNTEGARKVADRAEWVLTYGAQSIQERTGVDWQMALAEAVDAYGVGILHYRIAPELTAQTPDDKYLDDLPDDKVSAKRYMLTSESVGGDTSKGKYRETAAALQERAKLAKARAPFPFHVEVVAPDQIAFIEDESSLPGSGMAVHVKDVGIIDYNGQLSKDGLRLIASKQRGGTIKLSMEEFDPASKVALERPAPTGGQLPSVAGWKQRVSIAYVWTRAECYELAAPSMMSGASDTIINSTEWVIVKAYRHGYGRVPYVRAFASQEYNEWDPALRYQPALAGLYAAKPQYDYTRALEMCISTEIAIKKYFITQDVGSPPALEGDEEGDQVLLTRDSAQAQALPPGAHLEAVGPDDMSPAFVRSREIEQEEYAKAAAPTGATDITATTQPWNIRLGQSQANAYPAQLLLSIAKALAEMIRSWVDVAAKPVDDGGLGVGLYVPTQRVGDDGKSMTGKLNMAEAVGMEPDDWDGIWIDVDIDSVSSAERIAQTQTDLEILNNPIHVMTPEQFVTDALGIQDATGHMQTVQAHYAIEPTLQGLIQQEIAKHYGSRFIVGADGVTVGPDGKQTDPMAVLAANGVKPVPPPQGPAPGAPVSTPPPPGGMGGQAAMPPLPALSGNGAPPMPGLS